MPYPAALAADLSVPSGPLADGSLPATANPKTGSPVSSTKRSCSPPGV